MEQSSVRTELLKSNASVEKVSNNGAASLYIVSAVDRAEIVAELLRNAANVHMANNYGSTLLMIASQEGHVEVQNGTTALPIASHQGHARVVIELAKNGASVDTANNEGSTPLFVAVQSGHLKIVEHLHNNNANVRAKDSKRRTALFVVVHEDHEAVVEIFIFLPNGVQPDTCDKEGNTPLISACRNGHHGVVQSLLRGNTSVSAANDAGECALLAAVSSGFSKIATALTQAGATPHVRASNGGTILIYAARWGNLDFVNQLLEDHRFWSELYPKLRGSESREQEHRRSAVEVTRASAWGSVNCGIGFVCVWYVHLGSSEWRLPMGTADRRRRSLPGVERNPADGGNGILSAAERALVEMICVPNPSERTTISSVVEKLGGFAKAEATVSMKRTADVPADDSAPQFSIGANLSIALPEVSGRNELLYTAYLYK
ncbi:Tkl protein kinase, partial [Globisporangium splendens]